MVGICFFFFREISATTKKYSDDLSNEQSTYYSGTTLIRVDDMFSVQLLPEKVAKIIQIKEALNNKAHITQSQNVFSATSTQKQF